MGKYGEPWRQKGEACIVNCDGNEIYCGEPYVAYGFATATLEKHAVDCVNALSGRDPAKLEGYIKAADALEAAADKLSENALTNGDETATELFIKLDFAIGEYNVAKASLAAFEKGEGE